MKKTITLLLIFFFTSISIFSQKTKRVLFLGNSYTYVNNLPQIIADIANSKGDTLIFDSNTPGGYTLQGHYTNSTSLNKIMLGNWDFVVLQEQSQLPSFPDTDVQYDVFPYAKKLDSLINKYNTCAETIFYMTWGRKNGDAANCAYWAPVCTYEGMDSLLYLRYMQMTKDNNAVVSPVGAVWRYIRKNHPNIELYQTDESHPSVAGSYAAACAFYTLIFRKNPEQITFNFSLPAADARNIKTAVKTIVYDSLAKWFIGKYDPKANYTFNTNNKTVSFNNTSINAKNYLWNFGNGQTSLEINPTHSFTSNGNYSVSLIAKNCSYSDTASTLIVINDTTGMNNNNSTFSNISWYPNPCISSITLSNQNAIFSNATLMLYNIFGQPVMQLKNISGKKVIIHRNNLPKGIYYAQLIEDNKTISFQTLLIGE